MGLTPMLATVPCSQCGADFSPLPENLAKVCDRCHALAFQRDNAGTHASNAAADLIAHVAACSKCQPQRYGPKNKPGTKYCPVGWKFKNAATATESHLIETMEIQTKGSTGEIE